MSVLHSFQFLALREYCPPAALLDVSARQVFGRTVLLLPVLKHQVDETCAHPRWSIPATWSRHFHLTLRATSTMSFVLVLCLTSASVSLYLFSFPSSADSCEVSFFLLLSDHVWSPYKGRGISRIPGLFLVTSCQYLSDSINSRLLKLFQAIPNRLLISFL